MLPGSPDEREDSWEHALQMQLLQPACAAIGLELCDVVWDASDWRVEDFDAYVVGTTWDYPEKGEAFLARLAQIEALRPLLNPLATLRWNLDKRYLRELAARGVRTVPTLWIEAVELDAIEHAFELWTCDSVVVKPQVGAGAWRQARIERGAPLPPAHELPLGAAMIQPFLASAQTEGEYSLLYFDRRFSHAAQKVPRAGDYRVQAIFGGRESRYQPSAEELSTAQSVVDAISGALLSARVDLMRLPDGQLALMELELIEPYLYPEQGPGMGEVFASALSRLLAELRANKSAN
jgi:glutathione synthase/RimK-type ligase-like ATP-grasp enzyme